MHGLVRFGVLISNILGVIGSSLNSDNGSNTNTTAATGSGSAAQTTSHSTYSTLAPIPTYGNGTCPSRTANYITHTLPQQCLRTDRVSSNVNTTAATGTQIESNGSTLLFVVQSSVLAGGSGENSDLGVRSSSTTGESADSSAFSTPGTSTSTGTLSGDIEETDSPLDNANFLSFEEWKKQNLAKLGQDANRNLPVDGNRQRPGINNALDSLGEEGEIDIDFTGFGGPASGPSQHQAAYRAPDGTTSDQTVPPGPQTPRSKDAGKTCKERTNYASFDCAATMLKNNPECKSASSVLVENKDSYMLNTCSAGNKFFIVELCNDILIDTVVLANYEFFSSIFRHFRVSVYLIAIP